MELTKQGYENIITRIQNCNVNPPPTMNTTTMNAWLAGYIQCQRDILAIIESLLETNGR